MRLSHNDVIGLAILKKIEEYRIRLNTAELQPGCSDHVVEFTQFKKRCEWGEQIKCTSAGVVAG